VENKEIPSEQKNIKIRCPVKKTNVGDFYNTATSTTAVKIAQEALTIQQKNEKF